MVEYQEETEKKIYRKVWVVLASGECMDGEIVTVGGFDLIILLITGIFCLAGARRATRPRLGDTVAHFIQYFRDVTRYKHEHWHTPYLSQIAWSYQNYRLNKLINDNNHR